MEYYFGILLFLVQLICECGNTYNGNVEESRTFVHFLLTASQLILVLLFVSVTKQN